MKEDLLEIVRDLKKLVKRARFDYEYPNHIYPLGPDGVVDCEPKPKTIGKKGSINMGEKKDG